MIWNKHGASWSCQSRCGRWVQRTKGVAGHTIADWGRMQRIPLFASRAGTSVRLKRGGGISATLAVPKCPSQPPTLRLALEGALLVAGLISRSSSSHGHSATLTGTGGLDSARCTAGTLGASHPGDFVSLETIRLRWRSNLVSSKAPIYLALPLHNPTTAGLAVFHTLFRFSSCRSFETSFAAALHSLQ